MTDRVHSHPDLIFSVGTQVVTLADIPGAAGLVLHPRGTVGVVLKSPTDHEHSYRVRFPDGLEVALKRSEIEMLAKFKEGQNGYVLEQVFSPLIVHTTPEHAELKEIAALCITRYHAHHYLGFAETQWKLFEKENPPRVKPLLYVYRVLLTGIHLMYTGAIEANLVRLNETVRLPYLEDLIRRKVGGAEKERLTEADVGFHRSEYDRLRDQLQAAHEASDLPEAPRGSAALHNLLLRLRLPEIKQREQER
jgi:predicted nucleotidyltransferase